MLEDLRKFLLRGNVIDLAVAVIIGIAFGAVIASLARIRSSSGRRCRLRKNWRSSTHSRVRRVRADWRQPRWAQPISAALLAITAALIVVPFVVRHWGRLRRKPA